MIAKFCGMRVSSRASFVLMTRLPSNRNAGRSEGRLPLLQPGYVDFHRACFDPALARPLDRADEVAGVDERLARDASVVQALAAEPVSLDEEDVLPKLSRTDRGRIAARPRSDDHDVRVSVHGPTEQLRSLNLFADVGFQIAPRRDANRFRRKSSRDVRGSCGPTGRTRRPRGHR